MDDSRWSAALGALGPQMLQRLAAYLPNVLAAVALLVLGYVLARLSRASFDGSYRWLWRSWRAAGRSHESWKALVSTNGFPA